MPVLRRLLTGLLPAIVLLAGALAGERLHLVVLHTNDVHGQALPRPATWLSGVDPLPDSGGLPRLAAAVRRARRSAEAEGAEVLVVDAGDWFQGTPEGRLGAGRPFLEALTRIGYDAMAVGNHEFDHGVDILLGHLRAVRPPALLANATRDGGALLPGTRPYRIVRRGGIRIALVGLCSAHTPEMTHPSAGELLWREPAEVLAEVRAELEGRADWVLPLTHQGVGGDRELARAHPDLDLVVGGHSHSLLREGVREGRTLIVQAGSGATAVGRVDVWFDRETERVVELRAGLIELYREPADADRVPRIERAVARLVARGAARMDAVVGELAAPLPRSTDRYTTSPAGNLVTDALRAHTGADVALLNRGGMRVDLPAGPVTRRDLFRLLPFDAHVVTVTLSGAELEGVLRRAVEGDGHRGLELSGAAVALDRSRGAPALARVLVGSAPLRAAGRYRVTTDSFLTRGGDGYEVLARSAERAIDPLLLRDLLERAFAGGVVTPDGENRYGARAE